MDELSKLRRTVEEVIRENKRLAAEITELRVQRFVHFHEEECWVYQGDGSDYLESLVCPVIISPKRLLELENRCRAAPTCSHGGILDALPKTADGVPIVPGMLVYCGERADEREVLGPYGFLALFTREPARHGASEGYSHRLANTVYASRDSALAAHKQEPTK